MYKEIASNKRKTILILFVFVIFIAALAWILALWWNEPMITPYVILGALVYAAISYYSGTRLSLAVNGAQEIQKIDNARLYRIVENLAITEGLPTPKVYIMEDPAPNAFATGRDPQHSSVCVTSGLLQIMTDQELEGVLAHEMGHVKNLDIRVAMIAFALVAAVALLADIMLRMSWLSDDDNNNSVFFLVGLAAAIIAPIVASLIQLAVSRRREYLADATGALTTRYPEGLASALAKIEQTGSVLKKQNTSTAHFFFANPLKGHSLANLFSTHPPIDERIKRLRQMETHA